MDDGDRNYEQWAEANPRHAWALDEMAKGYFRAGLVNQLRLHGILTDRQMTILWEKADQLERVARGETRLPRVGQFITAKVTIKKAAEIEVDGHLVYQVAVVADDGWSGRFNLDPHTERDTVVALSTRASDAATIRGLVVWIKDTFVVLEDGKTEVELG